jgi:hypothetical protein
LVAVISFRAKAGDVLAKTFQSAFGMTFFGEETNRLAFSYDRNAE